MLRATLERSRELQAEPGLSMQKMAASKANVMTFGGFVANWAPAMKHSSFKDENEWRIADSGHRDQAIRSIVITNSGDPDHAACPA